jgi:hypothetical protein
MGEFIHFVKFHILLYTQVQHTHIETDETKKKTKVPVSDPCGHPSPVLLQSLNK